MDRIIRFIDQDNRYRYKDLDADFREVLCNITNPNSTYIKVQLKFKGYIPYHLHAYIDTGASICCCNRYVIPEEKWEKAKSPVQIQVADTRTLTIDKVAHDIDLYIGGVPFRVPTIWQQDTGMDILIGNNFLRLYSPFTQYTDRIVIHTLPDHEAVITPMVKTAFAYASESFMLEHKKQTKRGEIIEKPTEKRNIVSEQFPDRPEIVYTNIEIETDDIEIHQNPYLMAITRHASNMKDIHVLLDQVCSEDPLDPKINQNSFRAKIELREPDKVVRVKPMNYTPADREEFGIQIKELLDLKVIRHSTSPHSSPAFMVEKEAEKRRGKKRMVINYKALNKLTIDDGYYLPKKEELIALLKGKKIYSTFDCKSGFWQIQLEETCKPLTAFSCPNGQYEWNVVPFGLKQAPGIFQRYMDQAFDLKKSDAHKYMSIYVDDIIIYSDTESQHFTDVSRVLLKCLDQGIVLSRKKAQLFQEEIKFLGLYIKDGQHRLQDHILNSIKEFPSTIKDRTQLQRFLGCLTYAEQYIPNLAEARKPLQKKLKKDVIWSWTKTDTEYVDKLKKKFGHLPSLYHPSPDDKMIIETDASHEFWGAVLKANTTIGEEKLCRYTSGSFQGPELNYHSNEKEYLAVKKAIKKFNIYVISQEFLVRTDSKNFGFFLRTNIAGDVKQGRLLRWQQWFNYYKFSVEHIEGKKNSLADALTRELATIKEWNQ